jgi:DnaJ family protein C protein 10
LGIQKTATTREIRQAFKKLALVQHPDKNIVNIYFFFKFVFSLQIILFKYETKGDPNANEKFMKINRAYEILKDDELRKKYDLYGEKGLHDANNQGYKQYQSWNFYHQNFAIYDDDPEIITLSRSDFSMC